ncbi:rod shape-determining protein MreD [Brumimicrobium aurantiacum]|uniref:Rod shape-determining protein MreD n=1 Tax=Brumimicrobium aurantiacum TaxID=1737063 RepID=A0A3E1EX50_9FLAO|nr:rod shape-determining protein MreD [Brumimicrobium aurantiacum]RFC54141.1 rod shape-determining protein MreD [Brumimicrobium aurantiacum]
MNSILKNIIRLIIFVLAQGLIFGQLSFGYGIHPMIYPLFILMLPFDTRPVVLMILAFIAGIGIDFFMNTFGLHASASVLIAYLRPAIFRQFAPRDGYDVLKEPIAREWGYPWFIKVSLLTIIVHHLWFFSLEYFKWSSWNDILLNTLSSSLITLIIFILIQVLFFKKSKTI